MSLLIPIIEAAKELGIGKTKLYELVAQKQVDLVRIGSKSLIMAASLERLVSRLTHANKHDR